MQTVINPLSPARVILAKAGIHAEYLLTRSMDPRVREDDGF